MTKVAINTKGLTNHSKIISQVAGLPSKIMLRNSVDLLLVVHLLGKTVGVEAGWREDGLKAHNELRAAHGASPLVLDDKKKHRTN